MESIARQTDGELVIQRDASKRRMAKATLPDITLRDKRAKYGDILRRTREIARLNRDQIADALSVDPAQISRWESGDENPQSWRYQQHPALCVPYIKAQAEAAAARVKLRTVLEIEEDVA